MARKYIIQGERISNGSVVAIYMHKDAITGVRLTPYIAMANRYDTPNEADLALSGERSSRTDAMWASCRVVPEPL